MGNLVCVAGGVCRGDYMDGICTSAARLIVDEVEPSTQAQREQLYRALAIFGDIITGNRTAYKRSRGGYRTRFQAAAKIAADGKVQPADNEGHYLVQSNNKHKPKRRYQVGGALNKLLCHCPDATITHENPLGLCIHQIAAAMEWAIQEA